MPKFFNNNDAAFCCASFFELPVPLNIFVFFNLTPTLNIGLCLGPELSNNL